MPGRIVTFYSYQGGAGRSMALANVGWIMAEAGIRVLAMDWHLSAPSLDAYFVSFLDHDKPETLPGVTEFVAGFVGSGTRPRGAAVNRYAAGILDSVVSVATTAAGGALDFVPAGLQHKAATAALNDPGISHLLTAIRDVIIEPYDYVLVDCRDGMEDEDRVASILPPDAVVLCVDMAGRSIAGAADAARVVDRSRKRRPVRYFPVPMLLDVGGDGRRSEVARQHIRDTFAPFLSVTGAEATRYWLDVELPNVAQNQSEEIIAADPDPSSDRQRLSSALHRLASAITSGQIPSHPLANGREIATPVADVQIRYASADRLWAEWIASVLATGGLSVQPQAIDVGIEADPGAFTDLGSTRLMTLMSASYVQLPSALDIWRLPAGLLPVLCRLDTTRTPDHGQSMTVLDFEATDREAASAELLRAFGLTAPMLEVPDASAAWAPRFPGLASATEENPRRINSNLPARNLRFMGRGPTLEALRSSFIAKRSHAKPQVLAGSAGAGKTELAQEFGHRFARDYDAVWWIPAETTKAARAGLHDLAEELGLPPGRGQVGENVLATLRAELPDFRWLLIFDDVNDPADIAPLIPEGVGHVLLTSRHERWNDVAETVSVPAFTHDEAIAYLRRAVDSSSTDQAATVTEEVGELPLALNLAGAYLRQSIEESGTGGNLDEAVLGYVHQLTRKRSSLGTVGGALGQVKASATWLVSLERLSDRYPAAAKMFEVCAFLGPEPIPMEMLESPFMVDLLLPLDSTVRDPMMRRKVINEIARLGLAKVDGVSNSIQIHRELQEAERTRLSPSLASMARLQAYEALASTVRGEPDRPENWPLYHALWPHLSCPGLLNQRTESIHQLVLDHMRYRYKHADYYGSEDLAREAIEIWRAQSEPDHLRILRAQTNRANALRRMGRFEEARALDEEASGNSHVEAGNPYILIAKRGLAADYRALGRYREALHIDRTAWNEYRKIFGADDAETLKFASNLADSYRMVGEITQALANNVDTWERRKVNLGPQHPYTHFSASSYGRDLRDLGDLTGSKQVLTEAYHSYAEILGPDHPDTLRAAKNLAVTLRRLGEFDEAHRLAGLTLRQYNRKLGRDHPESLVCQLTVATTMAGLGRDELARQSGQEVVNGFSTVLGADHAYTMIARSNLAVFDLKLRKAAESLPRMQEIYPAMERLLGDGHLITLMAAANLANHYAAVDDAEEACLIDQRTLDRLRAQFDDQHPDVIGLSVNLAIGWRSEGRDAEAGQLMHSAKEKAQSAIEKLGAHHPRVVAAIAWKRWLNTYIDPPPL